MDNGHKDFHSYERSLDPYLADLRHCKPLTRDEEQRVARLARAGDQDALDRLVTSNLTFVVSECKKFRNQGVPFQDLIQEGNIGLIEAAKRFNPDLGNRLITYAVWWIRYKVLEHINNERGQIEVRDQLVANEGCMDLLEELFSGGEGDNPEDNLYKIERREALLSIIQDNLTQREAMIVELYYGIGGETPKTLMELQDVFNITYERIRQIKEKALEKLKKDTSHLL